MTTTSAVVGQSSAKAVDGSLWWESFTLLLSELESVSLSSDIPSFLVEHIFSFKYIYFFAYSGLIQRCAYKIKLIFVSSGEEAEGQSRLALGRRVSL